MHNHRFLAAGAALAVAVAAALPAAATAAAPWSPLAPVPGAGQSAAPIVFTPAGNGAALVTAARTDPASLVVSSLVGLDAGGAARSSDPLELGGTLLTSYAQDHVAVAGNPISTPGSIDSNKGVAVALGTPAGVGAPKVLPRTILQRPFALAGNARGDLALVTGADVTRANGGRARTLWLRRSGGSFRIALKIPVSSKARGAAVALGPRGDVLMLWEDNHTIYARHLGTTGRPGAVHKLGAGVQSALQAGVGAGGRLLAAWESQRVSEGEASGPATVFFTTAAPGKAFNKTATIETVAIRGTGRYVARPGVRLVVGQDDRALLAWTGISGGRFATKAMEIRDGHREAPQTLTPAGRDAVLGDAAVGARAEEVVLSMLDVAGADPTSPGGQPQLAASVRATIVSGVANPFDPLELLSDPAADDVYLPPSVAVDPVTGRVLAGIQSLSPQGFLVTSRSPVPVRS